MKQQAPHTVSNRSLVTVIWMLIITGTVVIGIQQWIIHGYHNTLQPDCAWDEGYEEGYHDGLNGLEPQD